MKIDVVNLIAIRDGIRSPTSRKSWWLAIVSFALTFIAHLGLISCTAIAPLPLPSSQVNQPSAPLLIGAAVSLQQALQKITPLYEQAKITKQKIDYSFASSGALQQQIEQGAPIDIFIAAASKQMAALQEKGLLLAGTERNLLTNRLVLVVPRQEAIEAAVAAIARQDLQIKNFQDLVKSEVKRIAIGEPRSVPAGQYATEVLQNLDILEQVQSKFVLGSSVKSVLAAVETGDVEAGIVYLTDAKSSTKVTIVATAEPQLHSPIIYPIAVLKATKSPAAAQQYVDFLQSLPAQKVFERYGFGVDKS